MHFQHLTAWTQGSGPLMILAVILVAGIIGERIARRLGIPGITGNLTAGILVGPSGLNLFAAADIVPMFSSLTAFAMVFIALAVGSQLSYRRIHNALRRILFVALAEAAVAFVLVTLSVWLYTGKPWTSFLLGGLSVATAPTTTLAIVRENRARGPFVKTLMAVVAIDCGLCILLFSLIQGWSANFHSGDGFVGGHPILHGSWQILGALILAAMVAAGMEFLIQRWRLSPFVAMFLAVLAIAGLSQSVDLNSLLVGLCLGVILANSSPDAEEYARAFEPIEMLLFTGFFTLAGVGFHWDRLASAGALCVIYVLVRALGKAGGAYAGGVLARGPKLVTRNMPFGLVPQAGVAVGLIVILQSDGRIPAEIAQTVATTVLAAVAINEIIGPFVTRYAIRAAREAGKDRARLMDFLQEEFILTRFEARDKWEAIEKMTAFFLRTHHINTDQRESLLNTIVEREQSLSTAIGHGIAMPHGRIKSGSTVQGILAISGTGVDFDAPDSEPVRIFILLVTPSEHEKRHLEILASLSALLADPVVRDRLIGARNAHDVWEVIEDEEYRDINYYFEDQFADAAAARQ